MKPVHFCNARLVDPATRHDGPGGLLMEGGRILDFGPGLLDADAVGDADSIDCRGMVLAPGIVDMHVSLGEPGDRHKESFRSAGEAAAAGGVTTVVTQPDSSPPLDAPEILGFVLRRAAADSPVRVHPMAALTKGLRGREMTEYGFLLDAGAVGFTDADRPVADAAVFRRCLDYLRALDGLVVHHVQEPSLSAAAHATEGLLASRMGIAGAPAIAEVMQLERDLRIVELTGVRYHADQVTTAAALTALRRAKESGLPVTAGVPATHLALNEIDVGDFRTFCKLRPPLRGEADRAAVEEAVADGLVDVIVSCHRPQDEESKRLPYALAEPGAVGLETLLSVALRLWHKGLASLPRLFDMLSLRPSRLLNLDGGRLAPGAPADLVLFDPARPWVVDRQKLRSKCRNSPFDGAMMQGRVLRTIVAGKTVYDSGKEGPGDGA